MQCNWSDHWISWSLLLILKHVRWESYSLYLESLSLLLRRWCNSETEWNQWINVISLKMQWYQSLLERSEQTWHFVHASSRNLIRWQYHQYKQHRFYRYNHAELSSCSVEKLLRHCIISETWHIIHIYQREFWRRFYVYLLQLSMFDNTR